VGAYWLNLAQDKESGRLLCTQVLDSVGNFLRIWGLVSFSGRVLLLGVVEQYCDGASGLYNNAIETVKSRTCPFTFKRKYLNSLGNYVTRSSIIYATDFLLKSRELQWTGFVDSM
jgi:hypothetical protein